MSVLDGFVRMRLYRERASEFELLAETEDSPEVRLRYHIVASHYRELVEREEKADKAMVAELSERARLQRQLARMLSQELNGTREGETVSCLFRSRKTLRP